MPALGSRRCTGGEVMVHLCQPAATFPGPQVVLHAAELLSCTPGGVPSSWWLQELELQDLEAAAEQVGLVRLRWMHWRRPGAQVGGHSVHRSVCLAAAADGAGEEQGAAAAAAQAVCLSTALACALT